MYTEHIKHGQWKCGICESIWPNYEEGKNCCEMLLPLQRSFRIYDWLRHRDEMAVWNWEKWILQEQKEIEPERRSFREER